jgi:hypothetical protein
LVETGLPEGAGRMDVIDLWDPRIALLIPVGIVIVGYVSKVVERSMFQAKGIIYRPEKLPTDARVVGAVIRVIGVVCFGIGVFGIVRQILRWRGVIL